MIFGGGFPREPSIVGKQAAQRAIFHVQRELETIAIHQCCASLALCDRGTIDGAAYWPGPVEEFWSAVGTTQELEFARYAAVIHLRTPPADQGYNYSNKLRIETAAEAQQVDERILRAWEGHPRRFIVQNDPEFWLKAGRTLELVRSLLPSCCRAQRHSSAPAPT